MARYNIALHNTFINYLQHTLKMTKEEAKLAAKNCKEEQQHWQRWVYDKLDVASMFVWGKTPEGQVFWKSIQNRYRHFG